MYNIAIDGPAGAGKSTIAKIVAKELGFIYVDTGSMYRTMALSCYRAGIKADEEEKVVAKCREAEISIRYENGVQKMKLNNEDVSGEIRQEVIGNMTSAIAVYGPVRERLVEMQRDIASKNNVVMDGRDIGTYVLPNAEVKIFQVATVHERAKRRYLENLEKGITCNLEEIEQDLIRRDNIDSSRAFAPLRPAEDSILLDTSNMSIDEVANEVISIIEKKLGEME